MIVAASAGPRGKALIEILARRAAIEARLAHVRALMRERRQQPIHLDTYA